MAFWLPSILIDQRDRRISEGAFQDPVSLSSNSHILIQSSRFCSDIEAREPRILDLTDWVWWSLGNAD